MSAIRSLRLPVHRRDWVRVGTTVRRVLGRPTYLAVALLAAALCLTVGAVAGNGELFVRVVLLGRLPLANRMAVLAAMYPFGGTGVEPLAAAAQVALALLVGVDAALLAAHVRENGLSRGTGAGGSLGLSGLLLGGLGAGCAVCGTSLLAGLLSLAGVGGAAVLFPFDGFGVTVLALVLVLVASFWIVDGMQGGACELESTD